jgi:hypothetical protein
MKLSRRSALSALGAGLTGVFGDLSKGFLRRRSSGGTPPLDRLHPLFVARRFNSVQMNFYKANGGHHFATMEQILMLPGIADSRDPLFVGDGSPQYYRSIGLECLLAVSPEATSFNLSVRQLDSQVTYTTGTDSGFGLILKGSVQRVAGSARFVGRPITRQDAALPQGPMRALLAAVGSLVPSLAALQSHYHCCTNCDILPCFGTSECFEGCQYNPDLIACCCNLGWDDCLWCCVDTHPNGGCLPLEDLCGCTWENPPVGCDGIEG